MEALISFVDKYNAYQLNPSDTDISWSSSSLSKIPNIALEVTD